MDSGQTEKGNQTNSEKADRPKINIKLSLGSHGTTEDFKNLAVELESADIFIPEVVGWDERTQVLYNMVSNGDETAEEALSKELKRRNSSRSVLDFPSWLGRLRAVYKTKKPVILIEPPAGHPILTLRDEAENFIKTINTKMSFDEFIKWEAQQTRKDVEVQMARELYMAEQLKIGVDQVLKDHPELTKKDEINVLIRIGSTHTTVASLFRNLGYDVERRYDSRPILLGYRHQAALRYKLGKEVATDFLAKVVFESFVSMAFSRGIDNMTQDSGLREAVIYKLTTLLDPGDIKQIESIYSVFQNSGTKGIKELLNERLNQKGIKVPETEKEAENFISVRFARDKH